MRAAPPCTVALAQPRAERALLAFLHALAAAALAAWGALAAEWAGVALTGAVLLAATLGGLLGLTWGARPLQSLGGVGSALHWSGRAWHLLVPSSGAVAADSALTALTVAMDLGPWLLLRAQRSGAPEVWLVATPAAAGPGGWPALRVALAAHAGVASAAPAGQALVG